MTINTKIIIIIITLYFLWVCFTYRVWLVCFVAFLFLCSVCATNQTLPFDPTPKLIWTFVDFGSSLQPFWFLTWFDGSVHIHTETARPETTRKSIASIGFVYNWPIMNPSIFNKYIFGKWFSLHSVSAKECWTILTMPHRSKTFLSSLTSDIMKHTQFVHVNTGLFVWILQQLFKVHVIKISPFSFCLAKHVAVVVPKPWHAVISTELPFTQVQK